jgi:folate-binding protein YgfZ
LRESAIRKRQDDLVVATHLEYGFPQWGIDIGTQSLPFDMGQAFIDATVSYTKGCYVGQEIIARLHASGKRPRDWVGLISHVPLSRGDSIGSFGQVTSSALSPTLGNIAAGSLSKHKAVEGEMVEVTTKIGIVEAEVRQMPLQRLM